MAALRWPWQSTECHEPDLLGAAAEVNAGAHNLLNF
jgi:hypothetical protein